ncbi:hypothetical protein N9C00_01810 [Flavobacteriales bacterium]|jgi:hypothetical protein|nr:hypothetical protein [Flavobacteriales bacterium]
MKTNYITELSERKHAVDEVLNHNRFLLKRLRQEEKISIIAERSFKWLRTKGFDFNYHTLVEPLPEGRLAVMCFEEGYVLEPDGISLLPSSSTALLS